MTKWSRGFLSLADDCLFGHAINLPGGEEKAVSVTASDGKLLNHVRRNTRRVPIPMAFSNYRNEHGKLDDRTTEITSNNAGYCEAFQHRVSAQTVSVKRS